MGRRAHPIAAPIETRWRPPRSRRRTQAPPGVSPVLRITSTFRSLSSWILPVVDDSRPLAEAREALSSAWRRRARSGVDEMNRAHATLAEHDRALHARRAGADDEDVFSAFRAA